MWASPAASRPPAGPSLRLRRLLGGALAVAPLGGLLGGALAVAPPGGLLGGALAVAPLGGLLGGALAVAPLGGLGAAMARNHGAELAAQAVEICERVIAADLEVGDHRLDLRPATLALIDRLSRLGARRFNGDARVGVGLRTRPLGVLVGRLARLQGRSLALRQDLRALLLGATAQLVGLLLGRHEDVRGRLADAFELSRDRRFADLPRRVGLQPIGQASEEPVYLMLVIAAAREREARDADAIDVLPVHLRTSGGAGRIAARRKRKASAPADECPAHWRNRPSLRGRDSSRRLLPVPSRHLQDVATSTPATDVPRLLPVRQLLATALRRGDSVKKQRDRRRPTPRGGRTESSLRRQPTRQHLRDGSGQRPPRMTGADPSEGPRAA